MKKIKIESVIFDFDGTLVDTENIYLKALNEISKKLNALTDVDFKSFAGYQTNDIYKYLIENKYDVPNNFFEETEIYFRKILFDEVTTFDGVMETLEIMKDINMVIASNSDITHVEKIANIKNISKYIKGYSCHNEELKAKPEPDLFLNAFKILKELNKNTNKENTIVFEDSLAGVVGAKRSGLKVIAITNSYSREQLLENGADFVVDKIKEAFNYIEL